MSVNDVDLARQMKLLAEDAEDVRKELVGGTARGLTPGLHQALKNLLQSAGAVRTAWEASLAAEKPAPPPAPVTRAAPPQPVSAPAGLSASPDGCEAPPAASARAASRTALARDGGAAAWDGAAAGAPGVPEEGWPHAGGPPRSGGRDGGALE